MKRLLFAMVVICALSFTETVWAAIPVKVQIEGINDLKAKTNAEHKLSNTLSWLPLPTVDTAVKNFVERAPDKIRSAMEPYGYFHAKVRSRLQREGDHWLATFWVTPGPVVKIAHIAITVTGAGVDDFAMENARERLSMHVGDTLQTSVFERSKIELLNKAASLGYFHGRFTRSKIIINLNTNQANIILYFATGPRFRMGATHYSASPFAPSFLQRFLTYQRGEYYHADKIKTTRQNFTGSPYFSQVLITPDKDKATQGEVPVNIELLPRKQKQFIYGFGYGTDAGVRGTLGMSWRYLNAYGHRFKTLIRASQENSQAIATYFIPGRNPATDQWSFTGGLQRIDQTNGNSNGGNASANYTTMLGGWQQTVGLNYLNERYAFGWTAPQTGSLLYPSVTWSRLYQDKSLSPSNGYSLFVRVAGTPASFQPTSSGFGQVRGDLNVLASLRPGTRLLLRGDAGYMETKTITDIPLSLQLFAGGSRSVRGYSFNSIGPGRNLLVGSVEVQQRIYGNFYLAAFYDIGNVANKQLFKNMNQGVGPAIVWLSPVGMLELSVAKAISEPNEPWKVQFSMGPVL